MNKKSTRDIKKGHRIGLYIRVSTEEQASNPEGSIKSQEQRLRSLIELKNHDSYFGEVVYIFIDRARSGKDTNRPELQRLLTAVRKKEVTLVMVTELSRLSRSIKDFCDIWELMRNQGCEFQSLREQFDTTTAAGEMMVFNLINFAQFERKQTAERISANCLSRAKRGLWNGGNIPLGYDRDPKNKGVLVPNEAEKATVQAIFRIFLETGSLRQTCVKLNSMGLRSKSYRNRAGDGKGGNHFTHSGLYQLLTNRAYIAIREIGKKSGKGETTKASWPAIIQEKTFKRVQKILESNKGRYKPDEWKTYPYPLTEKLICAECGKPMGGKSAHGSNRVHHYYGHQRKLAKDGVTHIKRCRLERVRAERTEGMVLGFLKDVIAKPEMIDPMVSAYYKQTSRELPGLTGRLKTVESEITQKETRVQNLVTRLSELPPEVSAEPIYAQLKLLNEKITFLKDSKIGLESETHRMTAQEIDRDGLKDRIKTALAALELAQVDKQRPIYANIIDFAELHPTKVKLGIYAPLLARTRSTSVHQTARRETRTPMGRPTGF